MVDEFFLAEPTVAQWVNKGKGFTEEEQREATALQRELIARMIPAYAEAAQRRSIEISTSPFYHPILPLLCDTNAGGVSTPGLKLPQQRFQHPEDAQTPGHRGPGNSREMRPGRATPLHGSHDRRRSLFGPLTKGFPLSRNRSRRSTARVMPIRMLVSMMTWSLVAAPSQRGSPPHRLRPS